MPAHDGLVFFQKPLRKLSDFSNSMSNLHIEWTISLFPPGTRAVFWQLLVTFGVPVLVVGFFIAIITTENRWLVTLQVMSIVAAILVVLLVLAVLILWLVGYQQHFVLDGQGVRVTAWVYQSILSCGPIPSFY